MLNANAEVMGRQAALFMNINAAKGLEDVMKTNLGPKGTIKMLVSGAGGEQSRRYFMFIGILRSKIFEIMRFACHQALLRLLTVRATTWSRFTTLRQ